MRHTCEEFPHHVVKVRTMAKLYGIRDDMLFCNGGWLHRSARKLNTQTRPCHRRRRACRAWHHAEHQTGPFRVLRPPVTRAPVPYVGSDSGRPCRIAWCTSMCSVAAILEDTTSRQADLALIPCAREHASSEQNCSRFSETEAILRYPVNPSPQSFGGSHS